MKEAIRNISERIESLFVACFLIMKKTNPLCFLTELKKKKFHYMLLKKFLCTKIEFWQQFKNILDNPQRPILLF